MKASTGSERPADRSGEPEVVLRRIIERVAVEVVEVSDTEEQIVDDLPSSIRVEAEPNPTPLRKAREHVKVDLQVEVPDVEGIMALVLVVLAVKQLRKA